MRTIAIFALALALQPALLAQITDPGAPGQVDLGAAQQRENLRQRAEELQRALERVEQERRAIEQADRDGVEVRIKDIARFRGVRSNQLTGFGLVIGLDGTGDSKKVPMTQTMLSNLFKEFGTSFDPKALDAKNVAVVSVSAELPPFAKPGTRIDTRVSSIGDSKSLQGGMLLQTPLYAAGDRENAFVVAEGPVSIGGFSAGNAGSSVQRNHANVGRIPGGGIVEASAPTQLVFRGNTMYLELEKADMTTTQRVVEKLGLEMPEFFPTALDGSTIQISLPEGESPVQAISRIESMTVFADVPAVVVINERTGTIVIGGNVRVGPAAIAHGSLNVRIDTRLLVSQPAPFSLGQTVVLPESAVEAEQLDARVAVVPPTTTVQDLARVLQALQLKPGDIISILQALRQQGALKARIEIQ
jgi:flagellar P-ring protein FlgI